MNATIPKLINDKIALKGELKTEQETNVFLRHEMNEQK